MMQHSALYELQRSVDALRTIVAEEAHRRQMEMFRLEQRLDRLLPLPSEPKPIAAERKTDDIVVPGTVVRGVGWMARQGWPIFLAVAGGGAFGHWLAAISKVAR